jgi:hypothetical protein
MNEAEQPDVYGISVQEAQGKIASLMGTDEENPEEQAEVELSDDAEQADDQDESEELLADDESEQEIEEEPDEIEQEPVYQVRANGQTFEVNLTELKNGYSRDSDYRQKSQSLASERNAVAGQLAEMQRQREQYAAILPKLQEQLELDANQQEPDFDEAYKLDPQQAIQLERAWTKQKAEREKKLEIVRSERQRMHTEQQAENQQQLAQHLAREAAKLPDLIPEWKDEKVMLSEREGMKKWAVESGMVAAEHVNQIIHASHVALLRNAWMHSQGQAKVKAKRKTAKSRTVAPGSAKPRGAGTKKAYKRAVDRLSQTGNVRDAAAAISQLDLD